MSLVRGDVFAPLIRDAAGRLAFGETALDAVRTFLGSALGPMRGRDGNVHRGTPRTGYLPMLSHLGAMISVVNGVLLANRMKGVHRHGGRGEHRRWRRLRRGAFHESLNQAAVERLPLVLVVANNQYAYSTPTERQYACRSLEDKAAGYGVESYSLEGNDLSQCLKVLAEAVGRARQGKGPQLVVARLLRLCADPPANITTQNYIGCRAVEDRRPFGRDCLKVAEEYFLREKDGRTRRR